MKKIIFFTLLICSTSVVAEPIGKWWSGWGMGTSEYGYKNDSNGSDSIYIACSPDFGTNVRFTIGGKDPTPNSKVIVVIDGEELNLYTDLEGYIATASRVGDANFRTLWEWIRSGRTMWVKLTSGESTKFPLTGSAKALPKEPCETDFAR